MTLQWRHNDRDGVSNQRRLNCLLSRLFRCRSKKTSKLRVTGLSEGPKRGKCLHLITSSWSKRVWSLNVKMDKFRFAALSTILTYISHKALEKERNKKNVKISPFLRYAPCSVTHKTLFAWEDRRNQQVVVRPAFLSHNACLMVVMRYICIWRTMVCVNYNIQQSQKSQHVGCWWPGAYLEPGHLQP